MSQRLLLVDDEAGLRFGLARSLRAEGYEVTEAATLAEAMHRARVSDPDLAILDYELPDGNALELMGRLRELNAELPVVILTGFATVDLAVRALQAGADQFLTKPVDLPGLKLLVERAFSGTRQKKVLASQARCSPEPDPFAGEGLAALQEQARRVAAVDAPVLILGETGTGKGVLARWLHRQSRRREEAFVDLNCAGLARAFLESELFGHEKGAFTGAVQAKAGLLELAHRGTLFLDEIGDMDPSVQAALLKVLEDRRFRRMGSTQERSSEMRLIAATHQDLEQQAGGRFRQDLFFRLSTVVLRIPPLRERLDALPALAAKLLARVAADLGRPGLRLEDGAVRRLQAHSWPGNVRELRNVLERAAIMAPGETLEAADLGLAGTTARAPQQDLEDLSLEAAERRHILHVLHGAGNNIAEAARRLGIARSTLFQKLKDWKAELPATS